MPFRLHFWVFNLPINDSENIKITDYCVFIFSYYILHGKLVSIKYGLNFNNRSLTLDIINHLGLETSNIDEYHLTIGNQYSGEIVKLNHSAIIDVFRNPSFINNI